MDELRIGDDVLTADGTFSKVYSFGHFDAEAMTDYLQIQAEGMDQPLEITPSHLLYLYKESTLRKATLVPAGDIKVGDSLVSAKGQPSVQVVVTSVRTVRRRGKYDPFTVTGDIVVNGVAASNYVSLPVFHGRVSYDQQHWLEHAFVMPYRMYCGSRLLVGNNGCENETYDETTGYSKYVMFWMLVHRWLESQDPVIESMFVYLLAVPGHWIVLELEHALLGNTAYLVAVIVLGYYFCWKNQSANRKKVSKKDNK